MSTELDRRGSSDRLRERVKFRFSGFRAVQVKCFFLFSFFSALSSAALLSDS
jgi:hypothetical protein